MYCRLQRKTSKEYRRAEIGQQATEIIKIITKKRTMAAKSATGALSAYALEYLVQ
jgi:hypothetical protein